MSLLDLCKKIIKYADNGDPVKDVIENTQYTEDEVIILLAKAYIKGKKS